MKKFLKNNICLLITVLSCLLLEGYGLVLMQHGYAVPQEGFGGRIALAALSLREGIFPWNMETDNGIMLMAETKPEILPVQAAEPEALSVTETVEAPTADTAEVQSEIPEVQSETPDVQSEAEAEPQIAKTPEPEADVPEEEVLTEDNTMAPEVTEPVFQNVEDDYFSDALFIGDSRIVGVCEYAGIRNATFYAKTSMTIYKMMDSRVETSKDVRTVREGLQKNRFRKIYLMVGLNEIGVGNTDYFINAYREVVQEIRNLQPDALIYIQGIMHVSGRLDRKGGVFSNETINRRNEALAALAEEMHAVYLDVNEAYDDEYGNLPASFTADDVHLKANHYDLWHAFYLTHAVAIPGDITTDVSAAEEGERKNETGL